MRNVIRRDHDYVFPDRVMRAGADEDKDQLQHGPQDDLQRKCAACEDEETTARAPAARQAYVAHMALRQVDWSIRHRTPPDVDHWLDVSADLLDVAL